MVRRLIGWGLKAVLFWTIWWVVGAVGIHVAFPHLLRLSTEQGLRAEADLIEVMGFPTRFDIAMKDVTLSDPRAGFLMRGATLDVSAKAWNPLHLTATWPQSQIVATQGGRVSIRSDMLETTVAMRPGTSFAFGGFQARMRNANFTSNRGLRTGAEAAEISFWPIWLREAQYDLTVDATGVEPTREVRLAIDRSRRLPQKVDALRIDATIGFDQPFDKDMSEPQINLVELRDLDITWGQVGFAASGTIQIDSLGFPSGTLALTGRNWREILALAVSAGAIPRENEPLIEQSLAGLARLSDEEDTLSVPLIFADGQMLFGPIPAGPAPIIRLVYLQ